MNSIVVILVLLTGLCYFGGSYCPPSLKKYKEMILGILVGYVLNLMLNSNVDGWDNSAKGEEFCSKINEKIEKNDRFTQSEFTDILSMMESMDSTDTCIFKGETVTGASGVILYLLSHNLQPSTENLPPPPNQPTGR